MTCGCDSPAAPNADFGGHTPAEVEGKFLLGHIPQAQREPLLIHFRAALRGEQRSFEYHSSESGRDYWVRIVPLADAKGTVTGGLSVALDISDRSQMERDLGTRAAGVDAVTERDPRPGAQRRPDRGARRGLRRGPPGRRRAGRGAVRAGARRPDADPRGLRRRRPARAGAAAERR